MTIKSLPLMLAIAAAPVLALADDSTRQPGSSTTTTTTVVEQTPTALGEAKDPAVDPSKQPGKQGVPPTVPQVHGDKFNGLITATDPALKTITVNDTDRGTRVIQVLDQTKGITGAEAASWIDLTVGAQVKGVCRRDGEKYIAESLSVVR